MTPDTRDPAPIKLYEGCFGITRGGDGVPQEVVGPLFPYGDLGATLIAEDGDGRGWKLDGSKAWNYSFEPIIAVFLDRASAEAALARDPAKPVQPGAPDGEALAAAVAEYLLKHPAEGTDERLGRAAAVRGMMVRMGLYADFEQALDTAIFPSPTADLIPRPAEPAQAARVDWPPSVTQMNVAGYEVEATHDGWVAIGAHTMSFTPTSAIAVARVMIAAANHLIAAAQEGRT